MYRYESIFSYIHEPQNDESDSDSECECNCHFGNDYDVEKAQCSREKKEKNETSLVSSIFDYFIDFIVVPISIGLSIYILSLTIIYHI